jgi:DNA-binding NarL/FixJ family response regulator
MKGATMGSVALFNTTSNLYYLGPVSATNPAQAATSTKSTPAFQEDTFKLSAPAQAKMLQQQGQSVSMIAASLNTTPKTVNDYLGITLEQTIDKTLQTMLKR